MGGIGKSHRICEYFRCNPKEFPTWLYVAIIINPITPHPPFSLFLHWLNSSTTKSSNPLSNNSIIETFSRWSTHNHTPYEIHPTYLIYNSLDASWNISSIYWIPKGYPYSYLITQHYSVSSSFTNISKYLPTHFPNSITESTKQTNGILLTFQPLSILNSNFNITMTWECSFLNCVPPQNIIITPLRSEIIPPP